MKKNEDCDALYDYPAHLLYNQIMAAIHKVDLEFCVKTLSLFLASLTSCFPLRRRVKHKHLNRCSFTEKSTGATWVFSATLLSKLSGCDFVHEIKAGGARLGGCSGPIRLWISEPLQHHQSQNSLWSSSGTTMKTTCCR